eukprot:1455306-Rhodomonas_salina.1
METKIMEAFAIPPFSQARSGKPTWENDKIRLKIKVFKELMLEHEKLMDYAAIDCVRWPQDPKNSDFVRQGVGIVQS